MYEDPKVKVSLDVSLQTAATFGPCLSSAYNGEGAFMLRVYVQFTWHLDHSL